MRVAFIKTFSKRNSMIPILGSGRALLGSELRKWSNQEWDRKHKTL